MSERQPELAPASTKREPWEESGAEAPTSPAADTPEIPEETPQAPMDETPEPTEEPHLDAPPWRSPPRWTKILAPTLASWRR